MAGPLEPTDPQESKKVRWKYPPPADVTPAEEEPQEEDNFAFFCTVPAGEAARVCFRLEAEGIPSVARRLAGATGTAVADDEPVDIDVPEVFLEAARAIVTGPEVVEPDDDTADQIERKKRLIEHWWCLKCGRQKLVNLPRSPRWRPVRRAQILVLLVPLFAGFVLWSIRSPILDDMSTISPWWTFSWLLTLIALSVALWNAHREKQCEECGWRTDDPPDAMPK